MKYLILIALFFVVLWVLRKVQMPRSGRGQSPVSREPERMVKCVYCGVNQPVSESILTQGRYFCCVEHRREAESTED